MEDVPVILFAFTRPRTLKVVLEAVGQQTIQPTKKYAFVDGHRKDDDKIRIKATAALLNHYGFQVVQRRKNLGCAMNIMMGIREVIRVHEKFTVLEDDTVPGKCWYESMLKMLNHYKGHQKVGAVGSFPGVIDGSLDNHPFDTVFMPRFGVWAWGGWRDKFLQCYDDWELFKRGVMPWNLNRNCFHTKQLTTFLTNPRHTWGAPIALTHLEKNWLYVTPKFYLSKNIGIHKDFQFVERYTNIRDIVPEKFDDVVELNPSVVAANKLFIQMASDRMGELLFP